MELVFVKRYRWFPPVISAPLIVLSFEYPFASVFAFFGLVPLVLFIYSEASKKLIFRKSWFAGFLFFAFTLRWFLAAFPVRWAGVDNDAIGIALVLFVWLGSAAVLGATFALFAFATYYLIRKNSWDLVILPALWVIAQFVGAWLFAFWSWGPEATLGPHWTFGNIGYSLIPTPFAFWSRIGGLYLLGFIAAFFNVAVALFILKRKELHGFLSGH